MTEVIRYTQLGKEDIRFGTGTFEVVLADGRKVILNEVDLGAILNDPNLSSPLYNLFWVSNYAGVQEAIDAAVDAQVGTLIFTENYDIGDLVLAPTSGQVHINFLGLGGVGANGIKLTYTGSGTALTIKNNTRYSFKNLRLVDGGTGSIGIHLTSIDVGSNHGPALFENVFVTGFTTDIKIGTTDNRAASELTFVNTEVDTATTGFHICGPTSGTTFSTNTRLLSFQATSCTTAVQVSGDQDDDANSLFVNGASLSENTLDFDLVVPGHYKLSDVYSEHSTQGQLIRSGNATATSNSATVTHVTLDHCRTSYPASPSNFVALLYQPGHYTVKQSTLQTGSIQVGGFDGGGGARKSNLIVENSTIQTASAPIAYKASSNTIWNVRHFASGDSVIEAQNQDEDRHYIIDTSGNEIVLANYGDWADSVANAIQPGMKWVDQNGVTLHAFGTGT